MESTNAARTASRRNNNASDRPETWNASAGELTQPNPLGTDETNHAQPLPLRNRKTNTGSGWP